MKTPSEVLQEAKKFTFQGEYTKALAAHEWYHENALTIEPAQYGVRLSFALSYWKELADKYPPALASLKRYKKKAEQSLKQGECTPQLFKDFSAISEQTSEENSSLVLFLYLDINQEKVARSCFKHAKDTLIKNKQVDLFLKYNGDIEQEVDATIEMNKSIIQISSRQKKEQLLKQVFSRISIKTTHLSEFATLLDRQDLSDSLIHETEKLKP